MIPATQLARDQLTDTQSMHDLPLYGDDSAIAPSAGQAEIVCRLAPNVHIAYVIAKGALAHE